MAIVVNDVEEFVMRPGQALNGLRFGDATTGNHRLLMRLSGWKEESRLSPEVQKFCISSASHSDDHRFP